MCERVISTKCPILNKDYRNNCSHGSPDLEVLVAFIEEPIGELRPTKIMCPHYTDKACTLLKEGNNYLQCMYVSWKKIE